MPTKDSYAPGTPSWVDLATSDQTAAKAFYGELFGWSFEDMPMDESSVYSMAELDGHKTAAIGPQQPEQTAAGVPPHWQMYVTVADVDASAAKVEEAGGSLHVPPMDVFDAGRMAVVTDPAGAFFMLWTAKEMAGSELVNAPGAFTWSELISPPNDSTAGFYETVTGMKLIPSEMPDGSNYDGFTLDGTMETMLAGSMPPQMPGIPPHWSIYFGAADVDASTEQVKALGGSVFVEPFDMAAGRMSICADPQGATFNLIQMPADGEASATT